MVLQRFLEFRTINDLRQVVDRYMRLEVDGDNFAKEKNFENAVKAMLEQEGFIVLKKQDVENTQKAINEREFANVDRQIPDISIKCRDGLALLELKFDDSPKVYKDDIDKIDNYLKEAVCAASGVLFLDATCYPGWKQCQKNSKYHYYWDLKKKG